MSRNLFEEFINNELDMSWMEPQATNHQGSYQWPVSATSMVAHSDQGTIHRMSDYVKNPYFDRAEAGPGPERDHVEKCQICQTDIKVRRGRPFSPEV